MGTEPTITAPVTPAIDTPAITPDVSAPATAPDQSSTQTVDSLITQAVKEAEANQTSVDVASVDYSTIYPDGHAFTEDQIKANNDLFKKLGVSEEKAKLMLEHQKLAIESAVKAGLDAHIEKTKSDWAAAQQKLQADVKQKFGADYTKVMATIPQAIGRFCDKETADSLLQYFDETGIGSDPRMITFMSKLGKTVSEDKPLDGAAIPAKPEWFPGSGLK